MGELANGLLTSLVEGRALGNATSLRNSVLAVWSVLVTSCSSGEGSGPSTLTIALTPSQITLEGVGKTAGISARVTRDGSVVPSATVLWVSNNPSIATVAGNAAGATITSVAPGAATVTASSGSANATVQITVDALRPNTSITFCGAPGSSGTTRPVWLAAEDSDGIWRRISGDVSNTYLFNRGLRGAVAYVLVSPSGTTLVLRYDQLSDLLTPCPQISVPAARTASGSLTALDGGFARVAVGAASAVVEPSSVAPRFTVNGIAPGEVDVIADRYGVDPTTGEFRTNKVLLHRRANPPNGGSLGVLDFADAQFAFELEPRVFRVTGQTTEVANRFVSFGTVSIPAYFPINATPGWAIPERFTSASDRHTYGVSAAASLGSASTWVGAVAYQNPPPIIEIPIGAPPLAPVWTTAATSPDVRLRMRVERHPDYRGRTSISFVQTAQARFTGVVFVVDTLSFSGTSPMFDATMADLSALPGWTPSWSLAAGVSGTWTLAVDGASAYPAVPPEGVIVRSAQISGTFVP